MYSGRESIDFHIFTILMPLSSGMDGSLCLGSAEGCVFGGFLVWPWDPLGSLWAPSWAHMASISALRYLLGSFGMPLVAATTRNLEIQAIGSWA